MLDELIAGLPARFSHRFQQIAQISVHEHTLSPPSPSHFKNPAGNQGLWPVRPRRHQGLHYHLCRGYKVAQAGRRAKASALGPYAAYYAERDAGVHRAVTSPVALSAAHDLLYITRQYINPDVSRSGIARLLKREVMARLKDLIPKAKEKRSRPRRPSGLRTRLCSRRHQILAADARRKLASLSGRGH